MGVMLTPSCQSKRENLALWELEHTRTELQERLNLLSYRLQVRDGGETESLTALQSAITGSSRRKQELLAQRTSLAGEIASLESAAAELEQAWILQQRGRAAGASFDRLVTRSGRVLENVNVTRIDDGGVSVRHEYGSATLRFDDLTAEQQQYFGLTESRATLAENREQLASAAYDRQIERQLALAKETQPDSEARAQARRPAAPGVQASQASTRVSPLAMPATRFGSRTWSGDSFGRRRYSDSPTYYYYYPSRQTCNPFYNPPRDIRQKPTGLIAIPNPYK